LRTRLATYHRPLVYVMLAGLALVLPGLLGPTYQQIFVNEYLVDGLTFWVKPMLWLMLLTAIFKMVIIWFQQYYLMRFNIKLALDFSCHFVWHVLCLPVSFFNQRYVGELGSRVNLNDQVANLLTGTLATTIVHLMMIGFYAALMMCYEWRLTLLGIFVATLNLIALKVISRMRVDGNRRLLQEQGKQLGLAMAGLQIIETIKASGAAIYTEDDVWAAAQSAAIADDIRAMPMGLSTYLAPGGGTLSGGQRQRILIARAIINKAPIMMFDEATSALDNNTQSSIAESLSKMKSTRVVIAQRLSSIIRADRIVVIDAGRIVPQGTYQELLDQEGPSGSSANDSCSDGSDRGA